MEIILKKSFELCNACRLPQKATKVELTFIGTNKNGFTIKFVFMNKVAHSFEPSGTIVLVNGCLVLFQCKIY